MSQENVEAVRAAFEAWNAGDMDAFRELYDPDVIWRQPEGWPEPGPFVGREAVMRQLGQQRETWDADDLEPISDFIDAADRVVVRFIWHGAGHGPEANVEVTGVFTVRMGRAFYVEFFWNHAEALETMGLTGSAISQEHAIRVGYRALSDGDVDAFLETLDPDIELLTSGAFPDFEPRYRGHDGMRRFWAAIRAPWEWFHLDPERIVEGEDCAAVAVRFRARGKESGVSTDLQQGHALWFRDGRTVKVSTHQSFEQALKAAGLSEQDAPTDP